MHEHKLTAKRHDLFSLLPVHKAQEENKFDLNEVEILDNTGTKNIRKFLEAGNSSSHSVNRHINWTMCAVR